MSMKGVISCIEARMMFMTRPFTCFLFYLLLFRKVNILPAFASSPWKCACNKNGHIILRPILEIVKS